MRADAEAQLVKLGKWPAGKKLPLEVYTLARYMTGEVGSKSIFEAIAVGEAAVNRAKLERKPRGVLDILLYRGGAGNGHYGPIQDHNCGRWATTSVDPTVANLLLADLILSGESGNFNNGADDQDGLQYVHYFPSAENKIRSAAAGGNYWVGLLPGIDHFRTTQWKHYGYKPTSSEGKALIKRAVDTFGKDATKVVGVDWNMMRVPLVPVVWDPHMPVEARLGLSVIAILGLSGWLAYRLLNKA